MPLWQTEPAAKAADGSSANVMWEKSIFGRAIFSIEGNVIFREQFY
jgi:hypothetical protein